MRFWGYEALTFSRQFPACENKKAISKQLAGNRLLDHFFSKTTHYLIDTKLDDIFQRLC